MKSFYSSFIIALLGFVLVNLSPVFGQTAAETKVKKIPFHGKLAAVDTSAQTITLNGKTARVLHLASTTKITDGAGNPSSFSAAVVGEDVGGSYTKDADGTMTLCSIRFGAKTGTSSKTSSTSSTTKAPTPVPSPAAPAPAPSATPAAETATAPAAAATTVKKQTFSGKVVSVDAAANTLVVHGKADQTFTVTPTTKITGVDGLASITAGAKVSGSYSKSADGATLTVYTLKVSK